MTRLWLRCVTGFYFAVYMSGAVIMTIFWFPLLMLFTSGRSRTVMARKTNHVSFWLFWHCARHLHYLESRFEGLAELKQDRGVMIVANHPSYVDFLLFASILPTVDCLVKAALLKNIAWHGVIKACDYLTNSDGADTVEECRRRFALGDNIVIFPEGTRTAPNGQLRFKHGFANIAVKTGCDIRMVTIKCNVHFLDKTCKWYDVPDKKPIFTVTVREKISTADFLCQENLPETVRARRLTAVIEQKMQNYLNSGDSV